MNQSLIRNIVQRVSRGLEEELKLVQEEAPAPRKRDLAFEALAKLEGGYQNLTKSARGAVNKALKEIREVAPNVTSREIDWRIGQFKKQFGNCTPTATSIARHWARLK